MFRGSDRIVQLAASQADSNHEVRHLTDFNTYINPGMGDDGNMFPIHPSAEATHGISADMVKDKPTIEKFPYEFRKNTLKENGLSVAYNAKFDIGKMNYAIDRWNKSPNRRQLGYLRPLEPALILDPFVIMQRIHPFVSLRKRLGDHYTILMGKPLENKHDAQADVDGTVDVLKYTLKYLEKHSIPLEWAKWAETHLPTKDLAPEAKASVIGRFVRENREVLKAKIPFTPEALKITDVLKFQHGANVYWDKSGLPKLDLLLNFSGWDGSKHWIEQDDYLDGEVAGAVRQERDTENRKFIYAKFANELTSQSVEEASLTLHTLLNPAKADDKLSRTALKNYKDGLLQNLVKNLFVEPLLAHTLPAPEENWRASKAWKQIRNNVKRELNTAVEAQLKNKSIKAQARQKLDDRLKPLADDIVAHMNVVLRDVGGRFFYTAVPVDPAKLIDAAVLEQPGNGKAQPPAAEAPAAVADKAPAKAKNSKSTKAAPGNKTSKVKTAEAPADKAPVKKPAAKPKK
jgi:DNA polymerase III epsilon subunit-like protein